MQQYWEHQALLDILQAVERPSRQPNKAGYHRLIAEWLAMVTAAVGYSSRGASLTLLRACRRCFRCICEACRAAAVHTVVVPYVALRPVANGAALRPWIPAASVPDLSNFEEIKEPQAAISCSSRGVIGFRCPCSTCSACSTGAPYTSMPALQRAGA